MPYLRDLGNNFEISTLNFNFISEIGTPKFALLQSFVQKLKILKSGTKNAEFENIIAVFEIKVLELALLQHYVQKQKSLNLAPKMPDIGIFGLKVENYIVIFEISTFEFI